MGMEYRNAAARKRRKQRREQAEQKRWESMAGPVEVRRLDDEPAEAQPPAAEKPAEDEHQD